MKKNVFKDKSAAACFEQWLSYGMESFWAMDFPNDMEWSVEEFHRVLLGVEEKYLDFCGECIINRWKKQHHRLDCYSTATDLVLLKNESDFTKGILDVVALVKEKRQQEREEADLYKRALELRQKGEEFLRNTNKTEPPKFSQYRKIDTPPPPAIDFNKLYPIEKQSEEVKGKMSDKFLRLNLYGETADIIKNEIKPWVDKRDIKDWNVLRYVLRKHDIFPDNLSHRIFADFLNTILGLEGDDALKADTISKRKDAQKSIYGEQISWDLKRDSEELEKMLKPVLDKMEKSETESEKAAL